jgi:hypothetical protein
MAKITRERAVKEKRALKQEKKEARKQAAAEARNGDTADVTLAAGAGEDALAGDTAEETPPAERPVEPTASELRQAEERRRFG